MRVSSRPTTTAVPAVACAVLAALLSLPAPAAAQGPTVTSDRWPRVTVEVPEAFDHVGSTTLDLYGVAGAEIHLLAEVRDGTARRLYWIQFEGVHEGSDHTYDYSDEPWRVEIGGRAFVAGPNHYPRSELTGASPGSDSRAVVDLVRSAGLELPDALVRVRLVHLDDAARNELLILYLEDVRLRDTSLARLDSDADHRERTLREVGDRAVEGLEIRPAPP